MEAVMTRMRRQQCLQHLAEQSVGRVGVTAQALPAIMPVNYTLQGDEVVFRTTADGLLARSCDSKVIAFEVDNVAADGSKGWSVLVVGVARLLSGREAQRAAELNLASAMGEGRDQFVAIGVGRMSGRYVGSPSAERTCGPSPARRPRRRGAMRVDEARAHDVALEEADNEPEPGVPTNALRAADVMSAPARTIDIDDSMWAAWSLMLDAGVRHVVVCDGARCVGVLDDRTLLARWPAGPLGVRSTPVRSLIRARTACVLPDTTLARVAAVMVDEGIDVVPVTSVDGTIFGVVTGSDLAAAVARYGLRAREGDV
jgi:CBS domain-containing protein